MPKLKLRVTIELGKDSLQEPILFALGSRGKMTEGDLEANIQERFETTPQEIRETLETLSLKGLIDYFRGLNPRQARITEKGRRHISSASIPARQLAALDRVRAMPEGPEKERQRRILQGVHSWFGS